MKPHNRKYGAFGIKDSRCRCHWALLPTPWAGHPRAPPRPWRRTRAPVPSVAGAMRRWRNKATKRRGDPNLGHTIKKIDLVIHLSVLSNFKPSEMLTDNRGSLNPQLFLGKKRLGPQLKPHQLCRPDNLKRGRGKGFILPLVQQSRPFNLLSHRTLPDKRNGESRREMTDAKPVSSLEGMIASIKESSYVPLAKRHSRRR